MASRSSSESVDPLRPADHVDGAGPVKQPSLGPAGYLRFFWRQLTSMRTALFLLLLLALAAVPGSLVPQVSSDPNGVVQFKNSNPELSAVLDWLGVFSTYTSVWFSAIYLLLFVSLIGCVIPRTKHHLDALRSRPPKTPARLQRLEGFTTRTWDGDAAAAVSSAERVLRRLGYRVQRYSGAVASRTSATEAAPVAEALEASGTDSVSAERGYLRETGNLVFHSALIGVLVAVGIGGGFGYTGQRVVVEGFAFANTLASYDSFNPGRFFQESDLVPYSIALDRFEAAYEAENPNAVGQAVDFTALVTTTVRGEPGIQQRIKVNEPLAIGGTSVYLLGNGYAPELVVRDGEGEVVFSGPTPFLPQDVNLFSLGVIKIPDGLDEQLGIRGLFYPSAVPTTTGTYASSYPELLNPLLTLEVYTGDLGLDDGRATNAYALNTDELTQVAGRQADAPAIELAPGERAELPGGLGSIELVALPRFVSLDVHHDPAQGWVLLFAALAVAGLLASLFVPRRRVWVKAVTGPDGAVTIEYAGLSRGDDPGLESAVAAVADRHAAPLRLEP